MMTQSLSRGRRCEWECVKKSPCPVTQWKPLFNQRLLMGCFFAAKARYDLSGSALPWKRAVQAKQSRQPGPRPQSALNTRGPPDSSLSPLNTHTHTKDNYGNLSDLQKENNKYPETV